MHDVKLILGVSRSSRYPLKGGPYRISLAKQLGAEIYALHLFDDVFRLEHWELPTPSLKAFE
jgi:hypothetical protein